jgi:hypothetical protein
MVLALALTACAPQRAAAPAAHTLPRPSASAVTTQSLVGVWRQPDEPLVKLSTHKDLYFKADGSGVAHGAVDATGVPGSSAPFAFTWVLQCSTIGLHFDDGHRVQLHIVEFGPASFEATASGKYHWATGGRWTRVRR